MNENRPLIIYHGGCPDGFCCAWIFDRFVVPEKEGMSEPEYWPALYDQDPPDVTGREVYIFDFSWKRPVMEELARKARSIVCYDHHKSAQAETEGLDWCVFDMERSGAGLVWDELVGQVDYDPRHHAASIGMVWHYDPDGARPSRPMIVAYVEDRDLWRFCLEGSREVNAAIYAQPMTLESWDKLSRVSREDLRAQGVGIVQAQERMARSQARRAVIRRLAGHRVPITNATVLPSETGHAMLDEGQEPLWPFSVSWGVTKSGSVKFELRSHDEGQDVSEIAKQFGGGGHRQAAGFHANLAFLQALLDDRWP